MHDACMTHARSMPDALLKAVPDALPDACSMICQSGSGYYPDRLEMILPIWNGVKSGIGEITPYPDTATNVEPEGLHQGVASTAGRVVSFGRGAA